jgi:methionyl-tRNA formyltransferase
MRYAIACHTPWFWEAWDQTEPPFGEWIDIRTAELDIALLERTSPRYVFFPHWSAIVPREVFERWECVCFHSAPVPYGRGGSPIQNMIVRGHTVTDVAALRMIETVDAGPVYMREQVSLLGGGEEVLMRIGRVIVEMIPRIAAAEPVPVPQEGTVVEFRRRTPAESSLPTEGSLDSLFDFIRMLDADGYPAAFAELGRWRLEFGRPVLRRGSIDADVRITLHEEAGESPDPSQGAA